MRESFSKRRCGSDRGVKLSLMCLGSSAMHSLTQRCSHCEDLPSFAALNEQNNDDDETDEQQQHRQRPEHYHQDPAVVLLCGWRGNTRCRTASWAAVSHFCSFWISLFSPFLNITSLHLKPPIPFPTPPVPHFTPSHLTHHPPVSCLASHPPTHLTTLAPTSLLSHSPPLPSQPLPVLTHQASGPLYRPTLRPRRRRR